MSAMNGRVQGVLDEGAILDRVGGDRMLLREIAGLFLSESPKTLAEMRDALAHRDVDRFFIAAHRLRGSVSNFSAASALGAAVRVERIGRDRELLGAEAACVDLEREIDRVRAALLDLITRD